MCIIVSIFPPRQLSKGTLQVQVMTPAYHIFQESPGLYNFPCTAVFIKHEVALAIPI